MGRKNPYDPDEDLYETYDLLGNPSGGGGGFTPLGSFLLLQDGISHLLLQDGTSALLLQS
jgi:hypothetical protein